MGFPLVAFIGALLAGPLPPPKTTCIPESGDGALAVTRMTMTGAPPMPRLAPLATWTGKELLLWARDQRLSGGEAVAKWKGWVYAYAPATDRWRRLSVSRSLPPRTDASLTWVGNAAILWGGYDERGRTQEGFSFDPATGRSRSLSTRGAPSARSEQVAVWTGSELLVWGGFKDGGGYLCDGGRYQPSKDAWTPIPPPPAVTCEGLYSSAGAAVWVGGRLVALIGHYPDAFSAFSFDPASGQWTAIPPSDGPRQLLNAELVPGPDGFAYTTGTHGEGGRPYVYRLDFQRKAWVPVAPSCNLAPLISVGGTLVQLGPEDTCLYDLAAAGCRALLVSVVPGLRPASDPEVAVAVPAGEMTLRWHGQGEIVRLGSAATAPPPAPAGEGTLVKGRATLTQAVFCGGAEPPADMPRSHSGPASGKKLLVRRGSVNRATPVIAEVTTDPQGLFELRLSPGTYCLIEEGKRDLAPAGALPRFTDAGCLKQWRAQCDATFTVSPGQGTVGTGVAFFQECFGRCYKGPLPP
ncbi:MAG TPA: hypothetical protein VFA20_14885 [Myxococcaceae bacterium]|nr:hypothetical protein [Myxococcaceae bacterium]